MRSVTNFLNDNRDLLWDFFVSLTVVFLETFIIMLAVNEIFGVRGAYGTYLILWAILRESPARIRLMENRRSPANTPAENPANTSA